MSVWTLRPTPIASGGREESSGQQQQPFWSSPTPAAQSTVQPPPTSWQRAPAVPYFTIDDPRGDPRTDASVWSAAPRAEAYPPVALDAAAFNPHRTAHVHTTRLAHQRAEEERRAAAEEASRAAMGGGSAAAGPVSLFRLPGPLVHPASRSSAHRPFAVPSLHPRTTVTSNPSGGGDTLDIVSGASTPLSIGSVSSASSPAPLPAHPAVASSNLTPHVGAQFDDTPLDFASPDVASRSASRLDFLSPLENGAPQFHSVSSSPAAAAASASPIDEELAALEREIASLDRQLCGESPMKALPKSSRGGGGGGESRLFSPSRVHPTFTPARADRSTSSTPTSTRDHILTTPQRAILDRYRSESQGHATPTPTAATVLPRSPMYDPTTAAAALPSVLDSPAVVAALQPTSMLDDSLPSTIGEEQPADISVEHEVEELPPSNLTRGAQAHSDPLAQAAPMPAFAPGSSLSDLMRISDLAYPELGAEFDSSRRLAQSTPWKARLHEEARPPLPSVLDGAPTWETNTSGHSPASSALRHLHDVLGASAGPSGPSSSFAAFGGASSSPSALSASSRGLLDPSSRLLESLWAAEDEFERMLVEEVPGTPFVRGTAVVKPRDSPVKSVKHVHFGPGDFIEPSQHITSLAVDTTQQRHKQQHHQQHVAHHDASGHQFLAVAEWSVDPSHNTSTSPASAAAADSASSLAPSSPSGRRNLLVGVRDFTLPAEVRDLADLELDARTGRLARLHDARGIGRLVPLQHLQMAHVADAARASKQREWEEQGAGLVQEADPATLTKDAAADPREPQRRYARNFRSYLADPCKNTHENEQPKSIYQQAIERRRVHDPSQRARLDSDAGDSRSPSPPRSSHLHARADGASVLRHLEARQVRREMQDMDRDLEELQRRAEELTAEHRADARELEAYQGRLARRKQSLLSIQLSHAQRHWLAQQQQARAARETLAKIDAIMATRESSSTTPKTTTTNGARDEHASGSEQGSHASPPIAADSSPHPPPPSQSLHPPPPFLSTLVTASPGLAPSPASPPSAVVPPPLPKRSASTHVARKPRVVKPPSASSKLTADLDSALSAAQHLMNQFMDKVN